MRRLLLVALFALAACASTEPRPNAGSKVRADSMPKSAIITEDAGPTDGALDACIEACEHRQMMRAVGWEVIRADCERSCAAPAE